MDDQPIIDPNRDATGPLDSGADTLFAALYADLHRVAVVVLDRVPKGQSVYPTDLIHEAYVRLSRQPDHQWESRAHFLNAAAQAMRCFLTDRARRRLAAKRGEGKTTLPLDDRLIVQAPDEQLLEVHEALARLEQIDPRAAKLVELTYFLGLTQLEAAEVLQISDRTARRDLIFARAWLAQEIGIDTSGPASGAAGGSSGG
ncbi:ECF-type sigma factor [Tuwongella immobilis]|uniref:RNA polymerase sigma-70 ECF-like HTH domain-containing protein n=1 Tax=Tuwongella immobilis TaxID=692036 RepID=A0A6C2YQF5_9BACT|nr:ECF-type sigma factor [Tuwongella immobilis]VIP03561.1 extracytoplasmic sigma factor ecf : RNA polymerase sigma-70 ECF-like protein OS=Rhodopirellula baltica SWK14 GN=RBSWK_05158 PE=4 SV=1: Sigma70_ECF [Tuwongella immobilis]VTS04490.1 extracytoplasmic sigma factor ecf : RNA polymerase sigma-70 ECF-like protein OS=Rhodopirellula baltica SWK14 GN=RBSWK_05158 PE=4 SV=1: Sigma70_ECF [Tuwongella immobilis]